MAKPSEEDIERWLAEDEAVGAHLMDVRSSAREMSVVPHTHMGAVRTFPGGSTDIDAQGLGKVRTSCVRVVMVLLASGRFKRIVRTCDSWGCDSCTRRRAREVVQRLEMLLDGSDLFVSDVNDQQWKAATKMARRKAVGYVGVKRPDDTVLIGASEVLRGRGWWLRATPFAEFGDRMLTAKIKRVDWSSLWRAEKQHPENTDPLVWRGQVSPTRFKHVMAEAGLDPDVDFIDCSPMEAAIRLEHAVGGGFSD